MFCYQCQETAANKACTKVGVCGKNENVANLQDLLVFTTKGLAALVDRKGRACERVYERISNNLFMTITNANFDEEKILSAIKETMAYKEKIIGKIGSEGLSDVESFISFDDDKLRAKAIEVGVLDIVNEDKRSLVELITYGLKGMAAYNHHAHVLGFWDESIDKFIAKTLRETIKDDKEVDNLIDLVIKTGKFGFKAMELLDKANTKTFGSPEISEVDLSVGDRPGILISGHDLNDMKMLLDQAKDSGVDIYTHSEMLPANYYPVFKEYENFHGNYGSSWWKQNEEFEKFNGPILMTTNCIVPLKKENTYLDRMFTTSNAGYPGACHIEARQDGYKDFSPIIDLAKNSKAPTSLEEGKIIGGFAHNQLSSLKDKIIKEIKDGNIKKFVVMAGCDGRSNKRSYYEDFAKSLPDDYIILTAGCAKYRYNKLGLGDINGIPRILDAGQCNDSYSLVKIALSLKEALGFDDINDLPIVYNIAWYEQKAVIVLLALLSLGVKNIKLGPSLPAFLSENVGKFLIDNFKISGMGEVEKDLEEFTV